MSIRIRRFICPAALAAGIIGAAALAGAQQPPAPKNEGQLGGNIKYNSGQSIQPIFEGWSKTADGGYQLWFGYLNRNHVEELSVPVGANNRIALRLQLGGSFQNSKGERRDDVIARDRANLVHREVYRR